MEHQIAAPIDGTVTEVHVARRRPGAATATCCWCSCAPDDVTESAEDGGRMTAADPDRELLRVLRRPARRGRRDGRRAGPIDVLTGDWLAELTMLILAAPGPSSRGAATPARFVTQMEQVMGTCLDRGIKVVSNAGGLDPDGCADAVARGRRASSACRHASPTSTATTCCPASASCVEAGVDLAPLRHGRADRRPRAVRSPPTPTSAAGASSRRSTGAPTSSSPAGSPTPPSCAVRRRGTTAGRATTGTRSPAPSSPVTSSSAARRPPAATTRSSTRCRASTAPGFPWAEVAADGSSVIGKHDGTGGQVSIGTVTSQLLYEIGGPRYLGPDVTARFDTIQLDRGRARPGAGQRHAGEPPPPTLKVAMNELGGYRNDVAIALTGLDIEEKAALVEDGFWRACPYRARRLRERHHVGRPHRQGRPDTQRGGRSRCWRLTVKDPDERKVGRADLQRRHRAGAGQHPRVLRRRSAGRRGGAAYGVYRPALVPAELVPQHVVVSGARRP